RNSASIVNKGHTFRRVVTLFESPTDLIREYDRRVGIADEGLDDEDDPNGRHECLYRGFQEFLKFFPWIKAKLTSCEPDELKHMFRELRKGADGAQGDDTSSLKKEVVIWLTDLYAPILPPISPSLKSDHDLDHDVTGRLLCPVEYDWDNAEVRKYIHERHLHFLVTEGSWLKFLYDDGYQYDPDNLEKGLFKSTLLLKAFKLIFTSPTSANEVTTSEHPETHNIHRRTRSSANKTTRSYLRFALSGLTCWHLIDGDFNTNEFYQNIINYFEAPPGPVAKSRVQELLLWWDRKVFGFQREIAHPLEVVTSLSVAKLINQHRRGELHVSAHAVAS
ncbi:hypothetical protein HD554DRAFT_2013750, partial [Boletus coccyginus]